MSADSTFLQIETAAHGGAFGNNPIPAPTEAQCLSGNYKVGRASIYGLAIAIEQPRSSYRTGIDSKTGKRWASRMAAHYGYINGTKGNDGDCVDCFIGFYHQSQAAFVINQNVGGKFDEHKVMLSYPDEESARRAYLDSYERGWNGLASIIPLSVSQLKWWLRNGDMRRPLRAENLPHEGLETMTRKVQWNSDALPYDQTLDQVLYEIRRSDAGESLLLDAVSAQDIIEDADGSLAFDALVTPYAKLERKMEVLQGVMVRSGESVKPVAMQVTEPFKQRGVANVAAIFELSDGQTVSIFFHNPDVTPNKMAAGDEVISWKWLLNKKDITIVVAPERGEDLNIREVARRIIRLAEKNSPAFQRANGKRAERMQGIQTLKDEITSLESELAAAQHELEVAKVSAEDAVAFAKSTEAGGSSEFSSAFERAVAYRVKGGNREDESRQLLSGEIELFSGNPDNLAVSLKYNGFAAAFNAGKLAAILANAEEKKAAERAVIDPASPDGYAQVMADVELQRKHGAALDKLFVERANAVRESLKALGWAQDPGAKGYAADDLSKSGIYFKVEFKSVDGSNAVGANYVISGDAGTIGELQDDLTKTPEQIAELANEQASPKADADDEVGAGDTSEKEIWQITQQSWFSHKWGALTKKVQKSILNGDKGFVGESEIRKQSDSEHRSNVEQAVLDGKPVPAEVLSDYPDLAAKVSAGGTAQKPDISYRNSADGLFTSFYPNTPEGEKAWNIINATPGAEGGKVLAAHAESTITQLRDAGYTVAEEASVPASAEEDATLLAELGKTSIPAVDVQNEAKTDGEESVFVAPSKSFDAYLDEAGGDTFDAANSYFKAELKDKMKFVDTVIGKVYLTGAGWKELKRGMKSDEIKARLTPHIVDVLRTGKYEGKTPPHKERKDGFVAFHFFEKEVDLSDIIVTAGVNVGQRDSGMYELTAYGLGHSLQEVWAKRKASDAPGNEPGTEAFQVGVSASLDSILGQGDDGINIVILKVVDKATGKRLTDLEDVVGQGGEAPEEAAGETAMSRIESILASTDGAAKVRYEAGGKVYISAAGDGKQGEMRYVLFYYKGPAGEFIKSYRHGNGLLSYAFLANVQKVEKAFAEAGIAVVDKEGNITMAPSQPEAKAATQEEQSEATEGPAKDRMAALKMLTDTGMNVWMSEGQNKAVIAGLMGEEWKFFADKMKELSSVIAGMPKTYDQDGMGDAAVAHLHYFRGAADWYITEKDMEGKGTEQAFGLADLGYGGELGYISIDELISAGVELDFHFAPKTVGQIKGKSEAGAPEPQEKAPEVSPEDQQKQADQALFQSVIDGSIPDILAPELADSLESAYYRQQTDPALVSLFEQAVSAYQNAMMSATAELA